jgi:hypothetical protein
MGRIRRGHQLFWFGCFLVLLGCGSDFDEKEPPPPASPIINMAGTWKGTATSAVTKNATNITLVLAQIGSDVSGSYSCAAGTVACIRPKGEFTARINQSNFTGGVVFIDIIPSGPSCSLHGSFSDETLIAQYTCNPTSREDPGEWRLTKEGGSSEIAPPFN